MEMPLSIVQELIEKAVEQAQSEFGRPICVAICDRYGFLLSFMRMPGAPIRSIAIAQGKAYTAARMGVNTDAFLERLHRENLQPGYFCDPMLTGLAGGVVLKNGAEVIGAIGVSGLLAQEDQAIVDSLVPLVQKALGCESS